MPEIVAFGILVSRFTILAHVALYTSKYIG
jgi:hypothetical protein